MRSLLKKEVSLVEGLSIDPRIETWRNKAKPSKQMKAYDRIRDAYGGN